MNFLRVWWYIYSVDQTWGSCLCSGEHSNAFRLLGGGQLKVFPTKVKCHICYSMLSNNLPSIYYIPWRIYVSYVAIIKHRFIFSQTESYCFENVSYYASVSEVNNEH